MKFRFWSPATWLMSRLLIKKKILSPQTQLAFVPKSSFKDIQGRDLTILLHFFFNLFIFLNKRCKGLEIFSAFRLVCPHFLNSLRISKDQVPVSQVSHAFLSEMNGLHVTFGSCTDRKPLRKYQTVTRTCSLKSFSILKRLLSNSISWRKPGGRC